MLPLLFRGVGSESRSGFARRAGRAVVFDCDIVAATLFLLSRWEETVTRTRDEHGRMPAAESVSFRQGFLDRPIVDEYALIVREWIQALAPGWQPTRRTFDVKLSHDLDVVWPLPGARATVGKLLRDLRAPDGLREAAQTMRLAADQWLAPQRTPYLRGVRRLADLSRRHGLASAFYVMATEPSRYDSGYDPTSRRLRRCLSELTREGFELGYHASYDSLGKPSRLAIEKARLDSVLPTSRYGGRQHYLRFRVPDTWRDWESVGLAYDSTLTFADHEGFRCGTCHAYRPFDLERDREMDIREVPLIVMDGTLRQYRRLDPETAEAAVLALSDRCRAVEGTFTAPLAQLVSGGRMGGMGGRL